MDENRLIGAGGRLPWRLPDDLQHFRTLTLGKAVLMGRKTWDSLGRPLSGRENWVLTRDPAFRPDGARVFRDLEDVLDAARHRELMVIGGAAVYAQVLSQADRIYLTRVHARLEGDTWFPELDAAHWREIDREDHAADARHAHAFTFVMLDRNHV